jgi:diguanylate cyclase (GGDEF)-like protein
MKSSRTASTLPSPTADDARPEHAQRHTGAAKSLRTRWNRAFAGLLVAMVAGGAVSVAGTHALLQRYRGTAHRLETEASLLATLRADIVPHALVTSSITSGYTHAAADLAQRDQLDAAIRADFDRGIAIAYTPAARELLTKGYVRWVAFADSLRTIDPTLTAAQRSALGYTVAVEVPQVLAFLDSAGSASRAAARSELARNDVVERGAYAGLVAMCLLVIALLVRLARRLSAEVIRPLGSLRESANQLADGDLAHRVAVGRDDEIGDLASSFNAMAESIAGSQQTLTRQANQDSLTGLANRAGFRTHVQAALARPDRRPGTQAVLFVDLDDFKDVNDLYGHAAGDELLRTVAGRLGGVVRPGDLVARLGGDEFALLLDGIPDADAAFGLAGRAVAALAKPMDVMGHPVRVGASIGVSMRRDGSDLDSLMREADMAMYSAKGHGKSRVECYDATLHNAVVEHQALKANVDHAAPRDELVLDYQPIIDLNTGAMVGVEALVRWQHPTRGLLPPSAFIRLAEDTGAIGGIGAWVLRSAAEQVQSWQRRYGLPALWLSVNVSVRQLETPEFPHLVTDVLAATGLDPRSLVLEVTESVLADPSGGAAVALEELRRLGIRVALDDFGTGYSSIGYLRELPVDVLKIDRSFVSGPHARGPGLALLDAIVRLGHHLGLDVIPEGIEQQEELRRLQALGCASGQGFLFSKPVPAGAIDEWLAAVAPAMDIELLRVAHDEPAPPPRPLGARADLGHA